MATKAIATIGNWTPEDLSTMKDTLAVGTTDSQFQLFIRTAHASGLNPFLNHIYAITYQGKMSLQIGIEGIAYLAKSKDGYLGYDAQVVCTKDTFRARRTTLVNADGETLDSWEILEHEIGFPRGEIVGAYAVAHRKGFRPFTVIMDWDEVKHFQTSSIPNQVTMWKKYTADMFKKHVAKRALKGQFGIDINEDDSGNVEPSIDNMQSYERQEVNVTPEAGVNEQPVKTQTPRSSRTKERVIKDAETSPANGQASPQPMEPPAEPDEAKKIEAAREVMKKNFDALKIDKKERAAYIRDRLKIDPSVTDFTPSYEQMRTLLTIMFNEIEKNKEPELSENL